VTSLKAKLALQRQILFIFSLQALQGEHNLVNLVEEWIILEEYTGEKLGFYQILDSDGKIEIRVSTGKLGYKKEYERADDPELTKILAFCKRHQFIRVSENIRDETFFK
jgi:hypothetical protein